MVVKKIFKKKLKIIIFGGSGFIGSHVAEVLSKLGHDVTIADLKSCLLYTSPSPRDVEESRMPSSA